MKIGVFGVGLIGGSLSIQAKKHFPNSKIFGFDLSKKNLDRALKLGLIDTNLKSNEIKGLDLILVTVPVNSVISIVFDLFDQIHKDSLIIDFSSTKKEICDALSNHPKRDQFLATHPIAGTEFSGPDSALENLFYNKVQNADPILKAVIRTLTGRLDDMNEKSEKIWKELHFLSSIKQELED